MRCPHCTIAIHLDTAQSHDAWENPDFDVSRNAHTLAWGRCPECNGLIVLLRHGKASRQRRDFHDEYLEWHETTRDEVIYPSSRAPQIEPEVPERYRRDFAEAVSILGLSPKASAALSRRIIQDVLREHLGIRRPSLAAEIDAFIAHKDTPTYLAEAVDAVRNIGNFAAHPQKDQHTSAIVEVEPGEAEWVIEVVDSLLDFAFVQPARLAAKRDALNRKLASSGKPPMKAP